MEASSSTSRAFPADTDEWGSAYPFSVEAERPLAAGDVMDLFRDHYEGTPSLGPASFFFLFFRKRA